MNEILIRKAKKGDKDAFCRLIDENVQSMYKVAAAYLKNDEDVADAIQDTILSCYENLKSLKQNRYFKTWMIRILINKCKDMIQKKKAGYLYGSDAGNAFSRRKICSNGMDPGFRAIGQ